MSTMSEGNHVTPESDFWEFVHCTICYLPFVTDPANAPTAPPSIPFWLTECGHTLCNNHLHADQSCAACGATAIQLVPLQRDMMPPMSDWFRSVPLGLDALASAAKSQQETMASLIRFYKRKCSQQRTAMNKTKDIISENKTLRSQVEQLQQEIAQLRGVAGTMRNQHFDESMNYMPNRHDTIDQVHAYQPSETVNANGKRPLGSHQHHRTSSPRSIMTPLAPLRLTLPPNHPQPIFPSGMNSGGTHQLEDARERPGSSRFERYAYQPPASRAQSLRQPQQMHGYRIHQQEQDNRQQHQLPTQSQQQQVQQQQRMPPPPTPSRVQGSGNISQHMTQSRAPFRPAGRIPPQTSMPSSHGLASSKYKQAHAHSASARQARLQAILPHTSSAPHQSRTHDLQPQPFPMSALTPASHNPPSRPESHGPNGSHATSNAFSIDRRFSVPPTPSNRFFPPRNMAGVVAGTPSAQGYSSSSTGGSARMPFVPGVE